MRNYSQPYSLLGVALRGKQRLASENIATEGSPMALQGQKNPHGGDKEHIPPPTGTLFVLLVYLAILAATWGLMFSRLIER